MTFQLHDQQGTFKTEVCPETLQNTGAYAALGPFPALLPSAQASSLRCYTLPLPEFKPVIENNA